MFKPRQAIVLSIRPPFTNVLKAWSGRERGAPRGSGGYLGGGSKACSVYALVIRLLNGCEVKGEESGRWRHVNWAGFANKGQLEWRARQLWFYVWKNLVHNLVTWLFGHPLCQKSSEFGNSTTKQVLKDKLKILWWRLDFFNWLLEACTVWERDSFLKEIFKQNIDKYWTWSLFDGDWIHKPAILILWLNIRWIRVHNFEYCWHFRTPLWDKYWF